MEEATRARTAGPLCTCKRTFLNRQLTHSSGEANLPAASAVQSSHRVKGIRRDARGRADMAGPERWWKSCGALKCRVLTYARRDVQTRRAASGRSPQRCFELAGPCELKIFSHPRDFVASIQLYFPTPSLLLWRSFPGSSPDWTCYFALWLPSCPLHSVNSYSLLGSFLSWCLASEW